MSSDWFSQKLLRDRAVADASVQGYSLGQQNSSQTIAKLSAELKRTRDMLELEQRRLDFVSADWVGARDVIRELRSAMTEICATHPDPAIRSHVAEGGRYHKDSIIDRWKKYADAATDEDKKVVIPKELR